ncbi:hypothetical protein KC354_g9 [Hortaea werneckii]|nr:hypothetical protein KC354_g9 [Hortaea werneckii]
MILFFRSGSRDCDGAPARYGIGSWWQTEPENFAGETSSSHPTAAVLIKGSLTNPASSSSAPTRQPL